MKKFITPIVNMGLRSFIDTAFGAVTFDTAHGIMGVRIGENDCIVIHHDEEGYTVTFWESPDLVNEFTVFFPKTSKIEYFFDHCSLTVRAAHTRYECVQELVRVEVDPHNMDFVSIQCGNNLPTRNGDHPYYAWDYHANNF